MPEQRAETNLVLVVLAAGEGRRYGGMKQLAPVEGMPMLRKVMMALYAPDLYRIILVLGAHADEIRETVADLDMDIVINEAWKDGMSTSIHAAIGYVETRMPHVTGMVLTLADQWKLKSEDILKLLDGPAEVAATRYPEGPGVPAYFPASYWKYLMALKGDRGARDFLRSLEILKLVELKSARDDLDFPFELP